MHHTDALPRPEDLIVEGPRTPDYAADGGEGVQRAGTCVVALYVPLYVLELHEVSLSPTLPHLPRCPFTFSRPTVSSTCL